MSGQSSVTPAPPAASAPAAAQPIASPSGPASAADMYTAFRAQRTELRRQLESLEQKRGELVREIANTPSGSTERAGLEHRLKDMDARIASTDQELAASDAAVARTAALPGAVVEQRQVNQSGPPEEFWVLGGLFMVVVLFPLSVGYARRLWRKGASATTPVPLGPELDDRLTRLEQAVDAIAVEVERVGEGQRFMSRQFTEHVMPRALSAGAAEPIELKHREQLPIEQRR